MDETGKAASEGREITQRIESSCFWNMGDLKTKNISLSLRSLKMYHFSTQAETGDQVSLRYIAKSSKPRTNHNSHIKKSTIGCVRSRSVNRISISGSYVFLVAYEATL